MKELGYGRGYAYEITTARTRPGQDYFRRHEAADLLRNWKGGEPPGWTEGALDRQRRPEQKGR